MFLQQIRVLQLGSFEQPKEIEMSSVRVKCSIHFTLLQYCRICPRFFSIGLLFFPSLPSCPVLYVFQRKPIPGDIFRLNKRNLFKERFLYINRTCIHVFRWELYAVKILCLQLLLSVLLIRSHAFQSFLLPLPLGIFFSSF